MIEVTMDQSGKVEIPEAIRKLLGLTPGSRLQMATDWRQEIWLRLPPKDQDAIDEDDEVSQVEEAKLIEKDGLLMVDTGPSDESVRFYLQYAVEFDRETRIRKLMGEGLWQDSNRGL